MMEWVPLPTAEAWRFRGIELYFCNSQNPFGRKRCRTLEIRTPRCARVEPFAAARLTLGAVVLVVAAASDLRTRRVRDPMWIGLGTAGLLLASAELVRDAATVESYAVVAATAILFYVIFFGKPMFEDDGFHARPLRIALFALAAILLAASFWRVIVQGQTGTVPFAELFTMPIMVLVYQGFYQLHLLHGGADTKGLIAITLLVPTYPTLQEGFPIFALDPRVESAVGLVFPFSLTVLVNAAVLVLLVPVAYLVYNAVRGDLKFPMTFLGYRAELDRLPRHVWLMEQIDERGEHLVVLFPKRGEDRDATVDRLRRAGIREAWVQPKLPFMVPLLGGFLLAFIVGNVLLAFLGAVLPVP